MEIYQHLLSLRSEPRRAGVSERRVRFCDLPAAEDVLTPDEQTPVLKY